MPASEVPVGGLAIETFGLPLHFACLGAHGFQAQVLHQPDRPPCIEARDMFTPDQGDHLAEPFAVSVNQAAAVFVLFLSHAVEDLGRRRVFRPQPFGILAIDAGIVLFAGNRKREDFLFAEVRETTATAGKTGDHGKPCFGMIPK